MSDAGFRAGRTVLVVDDNPDVRAFMQAALESAGYEVRTASEGAEALALQNARPANLLITDIFMPGEEGIETISACRSRFPQTRLIAMSAGGGTAKRDFLRVAELIGADATLRKPFTADTLLHAVDGLLRGERGR